MKNNTILAILFLTLSFCFFPLSGQIRPSIHFTEDDGLPGNQVMDVIRDKQGILWIATFNGIAKFDGDKFTPINNNQGLPLLMARALVCGEGNDIYAGLFQGGLALIRNDSVIRMFHAKSKKFDFIRKLYYSGYYKKLLVGTDYGLFILSDSVLVPVYYPTLPAIKSEVMSFTGQDSVIFFTVADQGVYRLFLNNDYPEKSYAKLFSRKGPFASILTDDKLYIGSFDTVFSFNIKKNTSQYLVSKIKSDLFIWNLSLYKDGKILIGFLGDERFSGGAFLYNTHTNSSQPIVLRKNTQSVNTIFYDSIPDLVWLARDNGLTAIFDSPFEYFEMNGSETIKDIGISGDSLMILTENGVYYNNNGKIIPVLSKAQVISKINDRFYFHLKRFHNPHLLFDNRDFSEMVSFVQNGKKLFISTQRGSISVPDMKTYLPFAVGTFKLINNKSAYSFVKYTPLKYFPSFRDSLKWIDPDGPGGKVLDISKIVESNNIYYCISRIHGLYAIKNNVVFRLSSENSNIDNYLIDIDKDIRGNIWCLSANGKLFNIDYSDSVFIKREVDLIMSGLIGNNCKWIISLDKYMLIGTNKGLNVISNESLNSKHPAISHFYNNFNGYEFISAESPVTNGKDKVYLHTAHEIIAIDTNFTSFPSEKIYIKDLLINGKKASISSMSGRKFPYNNKQISFLFNIIKYPLSRNIKYRYKVNDGNWIQGNQVALQSLRPNDYRILMEGTNIEDMSKTESILLFSINPPFWRTVWFIILSTVLLSVIIYLLIRIRINSFRKQQEEKTRQGIINSELRLRSLQIQMNPHFIFNALNAIQNFIINKNTEDSLRYLGELSSIIRTNLENASEEYITLVSEAEFLKKYIEIEKMRFKNKFTVNFRNNVKDNKVLIPPMLIQPLIENSINHGIRNRVGTGEIKVDISKAENILSILVEDNGVGRVFAGTLSKIGPGGMALKILSQRLDLLNEKYHTDQNEVIITDLYENEIPKGTRVEVNLLLAHKE